MSVHQAITKHSVRQHTALKNFLRLDQQREYLIAEALEKCVANLPFDVDKINQVTAEINQLAIHEKVPTRKPVTKEMVGEFAQRNK